MKHLKCALALIAVCAVPYSSVGQILIYSFTNGSLVPTSSHAQLTGSNFSGNLGSPAAGSGSPTYAAGTAGGYFSASNWTGSAPGTNYFEFTITPASGYQVTLASLSFGYRATGTGPDAFSFRSSADNFASNLTSAALTHDSNWYGTGTLTLTSTSFSGATTFRIYGSGASSAAGTFRVDDVTLNGSMSAVPEPSTYAAIVGGAALCTAMWRRRRAKS